MGSARFVVYTRPRSSLLRTPGHRITPTLLPPRPSSPVCPRFPWCRLGPQSSQGVRPDRWEPGPAWGWSHGNEARWGQWEPREGGSKVSSGRSVKGTDASAHELVRMIPLASCGPARPPAPSSALWRSAGRHCLCDPGETHAHVKCAAADSLGARVYTFLKIYVAENRKVRHSFSLSLNTILDLLFKTYLFEPCTDLRAHSLSSTNPRSAPALRQAPLWCWGLRPGKHRQTRPRRKGT